MMMLPELTRIPALSALTGRFLQALADQGFSGDIGTRYSDRLSLATDNSVYQCVPEAVVFPRGQQDIELLLRLIGEARFRAVTLTPRGGGTGTNGQSLSPGVIVDLSRYMNQILAFDAGRREVRVQAGVVKDQLNRFLRPFGYFFAPELSTSNRATLGGMINTDASGQGSLRYGKTADHVRALRAVLPGGEVLDTAPLSLDAARQLAAGEGAVARIYRTVLDGCLTHREEILARFPPLNRFLTGYDLRHVLSDDGQCLDLSRLLTGSEGTLAIISEATLNVLPLPTVRRLVAISYPAFETALRQAPLLLEAQALSVETIDHTVLQLARQDVIWHAVAPLIAGADDAALQALNLVEFAGDDQQAIEAQVAALCAQLAQQPQVIGVYVCGNEAEIGRLYAMRKKAVGLLGNTPGEAKPQPFVEDTCVPPHHLADYVTEFRALLDRHQLRYGMFGHVDAGVLHVRPALDLCDPAQATLLKTLSDEVAALTQRYGGILWGEHGKGYRAEYSPAVFGETLYGLLGEIKRAFDPHNQLNPGKICVPADSAVPLARVDGIKRADYDRGIPLAVRQQWRGALACNGNGLCFNFDPYSALCPSMKVTADRVHSPKGRAALVREWLRLLAEQGVDPLTLEQQELTARASWLSALRRLFLRRAKDQADFSHEVKAALDGCLACKVCATQCPVQIDVPAFRARFLFLYHSRYARPLRDYVAASLERLTPWLARAPGVVNPLLRARLTQTLSRRALGLTRLPTLSEPPLPHRLQQYAVRATAGWPTASLTERSVLIIQDTFTRCYDAGVLTDFLRLIEKLGYQPHLVPLMPNGKLLHIKGFLPQFRRLAQRNAERLNALAARGWPLVGLDPAMTLCYRDEYRQALGAACGTFDVLLPQEWLSQALASAHPLPALAASDPTPWYLFSHCTEQARLPDSASRWQAIFARLGATLESVPLGCCGMAGLYGHETQHQAHSQQLFRHSWQPALQRYAPERCLATGYSCRSQVSHQTQQRLRHPVQALLERFV